jgi:hypothetical protein
MFGETFDDGLNSDPCLSQRYFGRIAVRTAIFEVGHIGDPAIVFGASEQNDAVVRIRHHDCPANARAFRQY